jgi:threonine/homoserine/homoserine lactone efflux protein
MTAYVIAAFALVVTPGVTTAVVIRRALVGGLRSGVATALGAAAGNCTHAVLAGFGVTMVARQWPLAFKALTIAGGAYLCWLGAQSIRRGMSGDRPLVADTTRHDARSSAGEGLTVTLLNPSAIAFYLTVLPGYLPAGGGGRAFAQLAAIHIVLALTCHTMWAAGFSRIGALVGGPHTVRRLDVFAGVALVALGAWSLVT